MFTVNKKTDARIFLYGTLYIIHIKYTDKTCIPGAANKKSSFAVALHTLLKCPYSKNVWASENMFTYFHDF